MRAPICFRLERCSMRWHRHSCRSVAKVRRVICEAILERGSQSRSAAESRCAAELEDIINKALEKDRNLRYQHAADMRADLQRLKRDTETGRAIAASSGTVAVVHEAGHGSPNRRRQHLVPPLHLLHLRHRAQ